MTLWRGGALKTGGGLHRRGGRRMQVDGCKLARQRAAEIALWVRGREALADLPLRDRRFRIAEGRFEILSRQHAAVEQRIAEIRPLPFVRASERGMILVGCRKDDAVVVGERLEKDARVAGGHDDDSVGDAFAVKDRRDVAG